MIKNKTLYFLAKSLPYLKEDIDSIPKVVKLTKHGQPMPPKHHVQVQPNLPSSSLGGDLAANGYYDYSHVAKRRKRSAELKDVKTPSSENDGQKSHHQAVEGKAMRIARQRGLFTSVNNWNLTQARSKACEQKDGM